MAKRSLLRKASYLLIVGLVLLIFTNNIPREWLIPITLLILSIAFVALFIIGLAWGGSAFLSTARHSDYDDFPVPDRSKIGKSHKAHGPGGLID